MALSTHDQKLVDIMAKKLGLTAAQKAKLEKAVEQNHRQPKTESEARQWAGN
jgi:hypothetical protein